MFNLSWFKEIKGSALCITFASISRSLFKCSQALGFTENVFCILISPIFFIITAQIYFIYLELDQNIFPD